MVETGISLIVVIVISLFITSLICLILKGLKRFERNMISKIFLCVLYLLSIYLLLFKPYIYNGFGRVSKDMSITNLSLKPFSTIEMYLENKNYIPLLGSVVVTIPIFPIADWCLRTCLSKKKIFSLMLLFVCLIEPVQLAINMITAYPNKVVDIDDFFLNLIGYLFGFITTILIYRIKSNMCKKKQEHATDTKSVSNRIYKN